MSKHYIYHTDLERLQRKAGGWTRTLQDARQYPSYVAADRAAEQLPTDANVIVLGEEDAQQLYETYPRRPFGKRSALCPHNVDLGERSCARCGSEL